MKDGNGRKNILILANIALGDSVVLMPALKEFQKMYPKKDGYRIFLTGRSSLKDLYIKYSGCDEIEYIENDLKKIKDKKFIAEYCKLVSSLNRRKYEKVIIVNPKRVLFYMALCIHAKERYATIYEAVFHRLYKVEQNLILKKFDHTLFHGEEYFIGNMYRDLIRTLGNEKYSSGIPKITIENEDRQERPKEEQYVVVAPYGSENARKIPEDMSIMLIRYLLQKTKMSIYVVGTINDKNNHFMDSFKKDKRVRNYVGATSLDQLINIVYHCTFLIAVDSGVTHLAAALGIKNICIVGSWGKGQFLPYDYEEKEGEEAFPRCVFPTARIVCQNCDFMASRGKIHRKCRKNARTGKSYLCLEQVDVNAVYREIDVLLGEKEKHYDV